MSEQEAVQALNSDAQNLGLNIVSPKSNTRAVQSNEKSLFCSGEFTERPMYNFYS